MLRQPLIVSFIAVGHRRRPVGARHRAVANSTSTCWPNSASRVLLFLVGLKLDLNLVRTLGLVAVTTGLGQVAFTTAFGFLIAIAPRPGHGDARSTSRSRSPSPPRSSS
ncbi:MAG: hypothetical protein U5L06_06200 [Rhodovibrio sp.]|nr:hypothetical protein [Rhodovibrio sp.]